MATPRLGELATPRLAKSGSRRLSEFSFNIQKTTLRLGESGSRRLPDSPVSDSPTRWVGVSFFDHEYLREFEAKIGTARKVV